MQFNYFVVAWRNLRRHKAYSFIHIFGLSVGLCACLVTATVVIDDLSYDRQWSRSADLYRILSIQKTADGLSRQDAYSFMGLGPALKKNFPGVEAVSPIYVGAQQFRFGDADRNGVSLTELNADTSVWSMLDIRVLAGNPRHYVEGQKNLLISQTIRDRYFRGVDPIGKIIYTVPSYGDKPEPYLITGLFQDFPANTHLRSELIELRLPKTEALGPHLGGTLTRQYLLMKPGANMKAFTARVNSWYKPYANQFAPVQIGFQRMTDIYLHSEFEAGESARGSMQNIYIFSGIAALLLLIACINFINLSTARSITRLQETGVRKILGAGYRHIVWQFLTESVLFFMISAVLAIACYQPAVHFVERFLGHNLEQTLLSRLSLLSMTLLFILLISLLVGLYPAWILARFKPANALQGRLFNSGYSGQNWLRKCLVVVQFSISVLVLMSMIVVQQQVRYLDNKDLGFNKKNLLSMGGISWDGKGDAFKTELLRVPGVENASITSWTPSPNGSGFMSRQADDPVHPGQKIKVWYIAGDLDLATTLGLRLQSGRLLSRSFETDAFAEDSMDNLARQHSLITASTASMLGLGNLNTANDRSYTIPVGIVQDFHNESLRNPLGPTYIIAERSPAFGGLLVRVKPGSRNQVMAALQRIFKQFYPEKLLTVNWVDELVRAQYASEQKLQQLFTFFSVLSMILALLGIFGLIVHTCGLRVKEIGVRKVLGAGVRSIVRLLSKDFIRLVLIAFFLAAPVAWWLMGKWLQDFAYRIQMSWWMFGLAAGITLGFALLTVSLQTIQAALANPAKSLRSE